LWNANVLSDRFPMVATAAKGTEPT